MAQLGQWGMPLTVLAMLVLASAMGSALNRYQAYQSDVRALVRQLDSGATALLAALAALGRVPLSKELRLILRSEVLARYRRIRRLYRGYPAIVERIADAERALGAEGPKPPGGVGAIEDEQAFRKTIAALDRLYQVLGQGQMLTPLPNDVRAIFRKELAERRAEVMSRFHLVAAKRYERQGHENRARTHLIALLQGLRQNRPASEFVRLLYAEAEAMLAELNGRRLIGAPTTRDGAAA